MHAVLGPFLRQVLYTGAWRGPLALALAHAMAPEKDLDRSL